MKMWLNDKLVKESNTSLPCHCCAFSRSDSHYQFVSRCLLRTFNLRKYYDWCFKGYYYENMAKR